MLYQTARTHLAIANTAAASGTSDFGVSPGTLTITTTNDAIASTAHDSHGFTTGGAAFFDNTLCARAEPFFTDAVSPV